MSGKLWGLIGGIVSMACWALLSASGKSSLALGTGRPPLQPEPRNSFSQSLRFNVYTFTVDAPDSGAVREVAIKAFRGQLLLTNFRIRIDGAITGAEVADLDNNRFPELYIYSSSNGSGSFGRVYGWQFLPERKADVTLVNWRLPVADGYMGHDSLWIERGILCRKYPVYQFGDANAEPTGGIRMLRYRLRPVGQGFALVEERQ
ncbi:hypothetical protein [Spirosoma lacussanchae]|uniref:hypothetical protein n=1 Tax=Spirosoma lacussanchae TaxID=1884249 RepID=UPI001FE7F0EF|nr:hypothetical protein [Spirosoma lacussanchae]